MLRARITGKGAYLPERILSNEQLEAMVETSDDWIVQRTGMRERRLAAVGEAASDMGEQAALNALAAADVRPDEVDLILVATMTPDYITPSTAALIQEKIGARNAAAVDIQAACTGYLYGLSMAKAYVEAGLYRSVLLVAVEKMSSIVDYTDRSTCILFGDGAAAALVTISGAGLAIDSICLGSDGCQAELIIIPAGGSRTPASSETVAEGGHYIKMEGKEVFKHAVRRMTAAAERCLDEAGVPIEEIEWLVPHQANVRILEALAKKFGVDNARVYKTAHKYGNTSASSIAIALEELCREQEPAVGQKLLLVAFGAGLTWGAALLSSIEGEES